MIIYFHIFTTSDSRNLSDNDRDFVKGEVLTPDKPLVFSVDRIDNYINTYDILLLKDLKRDNKDLRKDIENKQAEIISADDKYNGEIDKNSWLIWH